MSFLSTPNTSDEMIDAAKSSATKKRKTTTKRKSTTTSTRKSSSDKYQKTGIPGLSVRFNWKEFLGINKLRRKFTKKTGIPTSQAGIERKIGRTIGDWLKGLFKSKKEVED